MIKVLALHLHKAPEYPNACQIYRTNIPFTELNKHQWEMSWDFIDGLIEAITKGGKRVWRELGNWDLVVLPRATAPTPELLAASVALVDLLHVLKIPVVYEVDDDFTQQYRDLTEQGIGGAMEVAKLCDAITVTTPYLAELMRREIRKPVYVLPNCVDRDPWTHNPEQPRRKAGQPYRVIGLSGSATHERDWRVLAEVLPKVLRPSMRLMVAGYMPEYLKGLDYTDFIPGMDYMTYTEYVRQCDYILCPIDPEDGFNMGKSPIKAIEGMMASRIIHSHVTSPSGSRGELVGGAAVIATDHPVYRLAVDHDRTGFLVEHTPQGWLKGFERVLGDSPRYERLQYEGHKWALKRHTIQNRWFDWASAYQKILRKTRL